MNKIRIFTILFALSVSGSAVANIENFKTLYQHAPKEWRAEVIPFPLGFAPNIPLKGVEELRFASGMYKPKTEEYFSYSFIWWLDQDQLLTEKAIEKYLLSYFSGLYKAVSKKENKQTDWFTTTLEKATLNKLSGLKHEQQFQGQAFWRDPFVTEKQLKLNLNAWQWQCKQEGKVAVFFAVSPQPYTHHIWETLNKQRVGICKV